MKKTKIALTATTLAILSLMIKAYHAEPQALPSPPHNRPVSEIIEMDKAYAPTIETPSLASGETQQISTHSENISEPVSLQNVQPQPQLETGNGELETALLVICYRRFGASADAPLPTTTLWSPSLQKGG